MSFERLLGRVLGELRLFELEGLGFRVLLPWTRVWVEKGFCLDIVPPIIENQMEKKMEHEIETGTIMRYIR